MTASLGELLFGTDEPVAEPIALRAGPVELELRGARLWHVHAGDTEVWHGAAFLYRDADWRTPEPLIERVESDIGTDGFRVRVHGRFPTDVPIAFALQIEGSREGRIRFAAEAVPRADILTNRLGLCLMHPMSAAGARIEIEHADGRHSLSTLPTLIPPWPPFMLIRGIRHEFVAGHWARCAFEGDVFELEDQRNNADASFKTYSRSNMMPRPYRLRAGVPVRQVVELALEPPLPRTSARRSPASVSVRIGAEAGALPAIGIEISPDDADASEAARAALRAISPARLHLALQDDGRAVCWHGIRDLLSIAEARLRLDVAIGSNEHAAAVLEPLRASLANAGIVPASLAVFPSEQACLEVARKLFPASAIGGGTPHFFVQLNRLENLGTLDFLTFTSSAIVHGADDEVVMLGLQSLPSMIETLNVRCPGVPIHIGPGTIATRKSPLGHAAKSNGRQRLAMATDDPRSRGLYGGAWLLGYVASLATAGANAITVMSLTGPSGVVAESGKALARYPTAFVLERLRPPARRCAVSVSDPRVAAMALVRAGRRELIVANLTGHAIDVRLDDRGAGWNASVMDAGSLATFASRPDAWTALRVPLRSALRLEAYAVASVEETSPTD
jgi:hypothetical protein